jgi:PucR C-terminal helix-turn-helix domain
VPVSEVSTLSTSDHDIELPPQLPEWAKTAVAAHDVTPTVALVVQQCTARVFAENRKDLVFAEAFTASVDENVHALRDVLAGRLSVAEAPLHQRLRLAEVEAELRIPQASLQRSFRISFFLQWQEWATVLTDVAAVNDIDRDDALRAMAALAHIVHAYGDAVVLSVARSFARLEDAFTRSRAHVRQRLVREILDGNGDTLSPADLVTLDYSLTDSHIVVYLPDTPQGVAESQLLNKLRASVRPVHTLVYPIRLGSCAIWLGSDRRWSDERVSRAIASLEAAGVRASISDSAPGLAGLLKTFEQVQQVEEVRASAPDLDLPNVIRYSELRLEILLLQSPELARDFLVNELGPLAEDTVEAAKLRATLEASFRFGSHVAAAEALQLHEHTVRNRLQKAHDMLGPLQARRTEIQVAMRLWRMLPHS